MYYAIIFPEKSSQRQGVSLFHNVSKVQVVQTQSGRNIAMGNSHSDSNPIQSVCVDGAFELCIVVSTWVKKSMIGLEETQAESIVRNIQ